MEVAVTVSEYMNEVSSIIDRGGPETSEYNFLKSVPKEMANISLEDQLDVQKLLSPLLTVDSMIGFAFQKPHGYAGDYEIIHRIYTERKSDDAKLYKWDSFYHELEAPIAVRNRKNYFKDLVNETAMRNESASVLNLGSGPCSDLYEYLITHPKSKINFECLDMDKSAIEYGEGVCDNYYENVTFINKNAFRFNPDKEYDLIWSAGMFDYFSDKLFVRLVNRMYGLIKESGELVIGNFSTYNPSRDVMEVFTQWYLNHRNEEELIELALKAGISEELISVSQEDVGVNLFLHMKKLPTK